MNWKTKLLSLFLVIIINILLVSNVYSKNKLNLFYSNNNPEIIQMGHKNESIFIISAFHDSRQIRIVGAIHRSHINSFSNMSCLFYYNKNYLVSDLSITVLPDNHENEYLSVYFECNLSNYKYDKDYYITIRNNLSNESLKINNVNDIYNDKIAICIPPLTEDIYSETIKIWLDYYKYMGIDKVIIYNMTAGKYTSDHMIKLF
jgi:hypothetical protein